ncbi:DUF6275 family protein [Enterococcus casseliflavus]
MSAPHARYWEETYNGNKAKSNKKVYKKRRFNRLHVQEIFRN